MQGFAPARSLHSRIIAFPGQIPGHRAEHGGEQHAGQQSRHEQRADRRARGNRIDDLRDRRQHQDAERAGDRDDAGAEPHRIAVPHHLGQHDRADRGDGGDARSAHQREHRACHDSGEPQSAVPVPDQRCREIDHPPRHAAMGQEIAGQDEERDRHDLEAFDAGEQFHRHRFNGNRGQREQERQHGETERDRNRDAGQHQRDQKREDRDRAKRLRQHDDAGLLAQADHQDQDRRHDQDHRQRARPAARIRRRIAGLGVQRRGGDFNALDLRFIVVRQFAGPVIEPRNLQEAEAHQPGAERDREVDDPHRRFQIVRLLAGLEHLGDERAAEARDHAGEERAAQQAEQDDLLARARRHPVDEKVHADMDAGAHAVGGAELGHPDEHVDAKLLRPRDVERGKPQIDVLEDRRQHGYAARGQPFRQIDRDAGAIAVQHREENQRGRRRDQRGDHPFFQMVERPIEHLKHAYSPRPRAKTAGSAITPDRFLAAATCRQFILMSSSLATRSSTSCPTRPLAHA